MSLYKQLWLSIAFLMVLAFLGGFVVSCLSAKAYLSEQLYRKNLDNVSSLALSLSSEVRDPMMMELFINAQYDSGHYQYIRLEDAGGNIIAEQVDDSVYMEAPQWLMALFPITVKPGIAQVTNGWRQVGTLSLSSHTKFAYKQLWDTAQRLFYYFLFIAVAGGLIGTFVLKLITNPLHKAVDHAKAIGERRFITTAEPKTKEFRAVIRSLNSLSTRVKSLLDEESSKLDLWRENIQLDKVTGLMNREPILNHFHSLLNKEDFRAEGAVVIVRVLDLIELNKSDGRKTIDTLLNKVGGLFSEECQVENGQNNMAGRLNGSDFLLLLPGKLEAENYSRNLLQQLKRVCRELDLEKVNFLVSSTDYNAGDNLSDLLRRLDIGLATVDSSDELSSSVHISTDAPLQQKLPAEDWKVFLTQAIQEKQFSLCQFPVLSTSGDLLHWETPVRLIKEDGSLLTAGEFIPHISRFAMDPQLDLIVAELAIDLIQKKNLPMGINLSSAILAEPLMIEKLVGLVRNNRQYAHLLWLEVPEYGAFRHLEGFRLLCEQLKPLHCLIGIEHIAQEVSHIGELHDLGLDYVKIDRALVHNIDSSTANQVFVRGLCTIVHSIGLKAIAEGVETETEWQSMIELGIDGGTGSYFSAIYNKSSE
jgi:EAL domain-containing protein (putative c-di-GMP-specific phosphodiesterase class I)/GGDEF domain-containing protein